MWGARLQSCGRCRSALREFGTDDADFDHPSMRQFPMRKVLARASSVLVASTDAVPAVEAPSSRSSAREWRRFAIASGIDPSVAETATKAELRDAVHSLSDEADEE